MKTRSTLFFRLILLLAVAGLVSCSSYLTTFQAARDQFSKGAEVENTLRFGNKGEAAALSAAPAAYYQLALRHANELLQSQRPKLTQNGLLLNTMTIKALSEWKLGRYAASLASQADFRARFPMGISDGADAATLATTRQRDFKIMLALPGMVMADSVGGRMALTGKAKENYFATPALLKTDLDNMKAASAKIADIRGMLNPADEVFSYLAFAQLATLKNWIDLMAWAESHANETRNAELKRTANEPTADFRTARNQALADLENVLPEGKDSPILRQWRFLLGGSGS